MTKNLSLLLNAALIIAVGVLFYLVLDLKGQIGQNQPKTSSDTSAQISVVTPPLPKGDGRIMFINIDSLESKYLLAISIKSQIEKENLDYENWATQNDMALKREYAQIMDDAENGKISEVLAQEKMKQLQQKQMTASDENEKRQKNMAQSMKKKNDVYLNKVRDFLKRKSNEHNYSYVLFFSSYMNQFYGNDSMDITRPVIEGLNAEYKAGKR